MTCRAAVQRPGHALTWQVSPEDSEQGITCWCRVCLTKFKTAEEWAVTACEPTKEEKR